MEHVDVGGRRLTYHRAGAGDPLVLLHGGWSDGRAWTPQLRSLADVCEVVAPDLPGCGGSSDPPPRVSLDFYADAVRDLVTALGLGAVHLGGLSFGGGLALAVAQRHPAIVRSLVLVGAYAGWAGSLPADMVAARVARIRDELARPPAELAETYLPEFLHGEVSEETTALVRSMLLETRPSGALPMLEAFATADLRPGLGRVRVPVLLMVGEHDVRAPVAIAEALHAALPDSRLLVVPGVGHDVSVEAPDVFDREVRAFIAGPPDTADP